jgi:hypothetical protein
MNVAMKQPNISEGDTGMSFGEYRHDFTELNAQIKRSKNEDAKKRLLLVAVIIVGGLFLWAVSIVEHIPL